MANRVTSIDTGESYLFERPGRNVERQSRQLEHDLRNALGFGAAVYSLFRRRHLGLVPEDTAWIGNVAIVGGHRLVDFLENRPRDLMHAEKEAAIGAWVRSLPRA